MSYQFASKTIHEKTDRWSEKAAGRTLVPTVLFILYAVLARDAWMILITFPSFLAIVYFSSLERTRFVNENDIINFICFLFFVVSPLQAIDGGKFFGSYISLIDTGYKEILIAQAVFLFFYLTFMRCLNSLKKRSRNSYYVWPDNIVIFFFLLTVVAFILHLASYGSIGNLLASRYNRDLEETSPIGFIWKSLQISATLILFVSIYGSAPIKHLRPLAYVGVALLAISINPFNIARNVLFSAWFPILFIYIKGRVRPIHLHFLFAFAVIFVMPVVNYTGREGLSVSESVDILRENFFDSLVAPISDVFDTLTVGVMWFSDNGFYYGQKTLGLLLFFVPRAIWSGKATLPGLDIGGYLYYLDFAGTANLSFFLGGDFFADFGLFGPVLGGCLTAAIVYASIYRNNVIVNGYPLKALLFAGSLPILIRGPVAANVGLLFFEIIFITLFTVFLPVAQAHHSRPTLSGGSTSSKIGHRNKAS